MLINHSKKIKKLAHVVAAIIYAFLFTEVWDTYIKQQLVSWSWSESTVSTIFSLGLVIPMFAIASYAISPDRTKSDHNGDLALEPEAHYVKIWQGKASLIALLFTLSFFTIATMLAISHLNQIQHTSSLRSFLAYLVGAVVYATIQVFLTVGIFRRVMRDVDHIALRVFSMAGVVLSYLFILLTIF